MGAILNGIAVHGGTRPYGGTFLVFSDYMRPAVRLAAIMGLPVTYVWTHDSVGLGEDGPTHQPVEHLAALRAIPGLSMVRPADANETVVAWRTVLERAAPAGLALSRQNLPVVDRSEAGGFASADGVARGAYVLREADGLADGALPDVVLLGHRLRGGARRRRPGAAGRPGRRGPGRLGALPGVVRRAGPGLPRLRPAPVGARPRVRRGRACPCPGTRWSATPAAA